MKVLYLLSIILSLMFDLHLTNNNINSFYEVDHEILINNKIEGKMKIDGEMYDTICDCDPIKSPDKIQIGKCDPMKLKIWSERVGQGASLEEVKNMIGNVSNLKYVKIHSTSFRCLDGRNSRAVLGTPGGDAGEFILSLSVYEEILGPGKTLSQDDVDLIFSLYLSNIPFDKFYMCTDDMAVSHLERELYVEGLNINNPRAQLIPELFNLITKPENIGDLHLKMLLKYPEQFSIRRDIVTLFLKSFYKTLWNKEDGLSQKLELEVLTGDHKESAFVEVRSENDCLTEQVAPLLETKNKSTSVFVNHFDAVSIRRYQLAKFFSEVSKHQPIEAFIMFKKLNNSGNINLENTGSFIAKGLPFYTINLG